MDLGAASFGHWPTRVQCTGEGNMEYDCQHFSVEMSSRWNVLSQWEMKVIFLLPILFSVASPVPVILDADSFLEAGGFWKIFESLASDQAEDLCSAAPTQTFWQSVEVSVSSPSQWAEYFATNYRPTFVPLLFLLCFCTAFRTGMLLQPCTGKNQGVIGENMIFPWTETLLKLQFCANENAILHKDWAWFMRLSQLARWGFISSKTGPVVSLQNKEDYAKNNHLV